MKLLLSLLILSLSHTAFANKPIKHFTLTYQFYIEKDIKECAKKWKASVHDYTDRGRHPYIYGWCHINLESYFPKEEQGFKYRKTVHIKDVQVKLYGDADRIEIHLHNFNEKGSLKLEDYAQEVTQVMSLNDRKYETGVFVRGFESNDPHLVNVKDDGVAVGVQRNFPDFDFETCLKNWEVDFFGGKSCRVPIFPADREVTLMDYDIVSDSIEVDDKGTMVSYYFGTWENEYYVKFGSWWSRPEPPTDPHFYMELLKDLFNKAKKKGMDFSVRAKMPRSIYKDLPYQSEPFELD